MQNQINIYIQYTYVHTYFCILICASKDTLTIIFDEIVFVICFSKDCCRISRNKLRNNKQKINKTEQFLCKRSFETVNGY